MAKNNPIQSVHNLKDLIGQTFGQLTVIKRAGTNRERKATWLCQCVCGNSVVRVGKYLRNRDTKSCGCLKIRSKHGHAAGQQHSATYNSWLAMKSRCFNTDAMGYERYGGRGVTVCQRWRDSFENFLADMRERPDNATIERIDNN